MHIGFKLRIAFLRLVAGKVTRLLLEGNTPLDRSMDFSNDFK